MLLTIDLAQWMLLTLNVVWVGVMFSLAFLAIWYFGVAILILRSRANLSALEYSLGGVWLVFKGWRNFVRYLLAIIACGVMLIAATLRRIIQLGVEDGLTNFMIDLVEADYGPVLNSVLYKAESKHSEEIGALKERLRLAEAETKRTKAKLTHIQKLSNLDGTLDQTKREMEAYLETLRRDGKSQNGSNGNSNGSSSKKDRNNNNRRDDRDYDNRDRNDRNDNRNRRDDNSMTREFEPVRRSDGRANGSKLPPAPVGHTYR